MTGALLAAAPANCNVDNSHLFNGCGYPAPGLQDFDFRPLFTIGSFNFTKPELIAILCALLVIACAQDLSSLTPFPCALDGTCPAGYDCTAEKQCEPAPTCAQGMVDCAGTCVVTASDPENCGMCGKPCAAPMMCCGGTCCSEASCCGAASGSQVCSDLQSDPDNCNQCGTVCPTNDACSGGVCDALTVPRQLTPIRKPSGSLAAVGFNSSRTIWLYGLFFSSASSSHGVMLLRCAISAM